jgi:hypothetical protein
LDGVAALLRTVAVDSSFMQRKEAPPRTAGRVRLAGPRGQRNARPDDTSASRCRSKP